MTFYEGIVLAIASIGAVLGIMNTWNQMSKERLRLKVIPAHTLPVGPAGAGDWTMSIEVVNLSAFAVTIVEVGLELRGTREHMVVPRPITTDGRGLPHRLEPREAVTVMFDPEDCSHPRLPEVHKAYTRTQCGTVKYGTSPALGQLIREAQRRR